MNPEPENNSLRVLAIVNLPWDPRLGAARVWIELCDEWRQAGHVVEKFCLTDAFPNPTSSRGLLLGQRFFHPRRALSAKRAPLDYRLLMAHSFYKSPWFSRFSLRPVGLLALRPFLFCPASGPDQRKGRLSEVCFINYVRGGADKEDEGFALRPDNLPKSRAGGIESSPHSQTCDYSTLL